VSEIILRGRGKLYNSEGARILISVTYEITEKPEWVGTLSGWQGQCTADSNIAPGKCVIQLQDGRRGICMVKPKIMSVGGRGAVYSVQGTGKLE
jgi:hypothetical protein